MDDMEQIYKKHAKTVYGFLLTKTQNPDLAEELTQETFYQAVKHLESFQGNSNVSTWLCGIAKNLWYDTLRRQKKQTGPKELSDLPLPSAESEYFKSWENIEILKQLHSLKEPVREVMYLRLIGNLTFGQIGEIMEKSENWARVTYYRGKEKIIKEAEIS